MKIYSLISSNGTSGFDVVFEDEFFFVLFLLAVFMMELVTFVSNYFKLPYVPNRLDKFNVLDNFQDILGIFVIID